VNLQLLSRAIFDAPIVYKLALAALLILTAAAFGVWIWIAVRSVVDLWVEKRRERLPKDTELGARGKQEA
jgi:hypothetical protein